MGGGFKKVLALVAIVLGIAGCKKNDAVQGTQRGTGTANTVSFSPALSAAKPAAGPWKVPAGARAAESNADATALGVNLTAHLVERVQKTEIHGARHVELLLVLEGAGGAIMADVTEEGLAQDGAQSVKALPAGARRSRRQLLGKQRRAEAGLVERWRILGSILRTYPEARTKKANGDVKLTPTASAISPCAGDFD